MNIIELLQGQLSDGLLDQLSQSAGGASREQTQAAASGILSTLTSALAKNAARPGGANALVSALDRDHDGSVLDDVMGFLGGSRKPVNERTMNGSGILKHILGERQDGVSNMIGKMTGMESGNVGNLMSILAPMVMGALGKARNQHGMNTNGIVDLLSSSVRSEENQRQEMGLLGRFLDADGDGSIMDDLANMGMKAFLRR